MAVTRLRYHSDPYPAAGSYEEAGPGLDKLLLRRMEPLLELDGRDEGTFSYSRLPDDIVLITRKDGTSARALCLDGESAKLEGLLPLDLWRSPLWDHWDDGEVWEEDAALPQGERLDRSQLVEAIRRAEDAAPGRLARFLTDVKGLFASEPGRQIILIAQPADIACFIQMACQSIPRDRASRLTFTSRSADPHTAYQQIVGVPEGQAVEFTAAEVRYQYRVHDLVTGRLDSPAEEPDPRALRFASEWLANGDGDGEGDDGAQAGDGSSDRSPGKLSVEDALDLIVTIEDRQEPEPLDEDLLERLVAAVLQAPKVTDRVLILNSHLRGLELRPAHQGALNVVFHANRLQYEQDLGSVEAHMRWIAKSLRMCRDDVEFPAEIEWWWIDKVLRALFRRGPDKLWVKTAPLVARCVSEALLRGYVEQVQTLPGVKVDLIDHPELLSEAMAVWQLNWGKNPHWGTVRRQLSAFADEVHGPHSRKTRKAREAASRLVSEWEGDASP